MDVRQLFGPSRDEQDARGMTVKRTRKRIPGACYKCGNPGHRWGHCPLSRCFRCGRKGHIQRFCRKRSLETSMSKMKVGCYFCGKFGHLKRNCRYIRCNNCGLKGHAKRICPTRKAGLTSQRVVQFTGADLSGIHQSEDSEAESHTGVPESSQHL